MYKKCKSVPEIVQEMKKLDEFGNTAISEYVDFDLRDTIEKIDAYLNSQHTSGKDDYNGRPKPFFNIVTSAVNIWWRATDIDRKNIRIKATKRGQTVLSFLVSILLQDWMRKSGFGRFLNDWGLTMARYGSAVAKFVEKDGELIAEVIPWNRLLCDPVDFNNNVKIERLWLTPQQLRRNKAYDQEFVEQLIENPVSRRTMDNQQVDTKAEYIEVYEVHGELPLSLLTDNEEDDEEYVQQMHVISFQYKKTETEETAYTLYRGKEKQDPYYISHLIKEDGRALSIGAVEHLFEAQWMVNNSAKQIYDHLELTSKIVFQTADGNLVGQNVLNSIENGEILLHRDNAPVTMLANQPNIAAMQAFGAQWQQLANQVTNTPEAMRGETPPSGTAWRLQETVLAQSNSLFELMTENKALQLEEMLRIYVLPHFKKQLDTSDEISAILEDHQIKQIDAWYLPKEVSRMVNEKMKQTILSGQIYEPEQAIQDEMQATQMVQEQLSEMGNQRFIKPSEVEDKTWKEITKDLEWELEIDITGESRDRQSILTTLNTVLSTVAGNPMILQDPNAKLVFNKILNEVGVISPLELQEVQNVQPAMQTSAPQPITA